MATTDDEGASTRSRGSLETIIHHEGSALARSASRSSLASASAHSQDQGPDGMTEMVCEEEGIQAPLEEQAVRGATRQTNYPFLLRGRFERELGGHQAGIAVAGGHRCEVRPCRTLDAAGSAAAAG